MPRIPKVVGEGTYGCVHEPSLECAKLDYLSELIAEFLGLIYMSTRQNLENFIERHVKPTGSYRSYESALFLARNLSYNKSINLYYWRNVQNEEVDFVIKEGAGNS
jgi:hypothetical protein